MVEIVYDYVDSWPEAGAMQVNVPAITLEIPISPDVARRRANGYIGVHIGLLLGSSEPRLVLDTPPRWKLAIHLHLPSIGQVGHVGSIDVNAMTGEVIAPSATTIQDIQERARDLTLRFASTAEPAV